MSKPLVSILDYGMGNLFSVRSAFEHCGAEARLVSSASDISKATKLVLPGVGAFADGMQMLKKLDVIDALNEYAKSGRPFLGICLGMQMMMQESEEFGRHEGLGWIRGRVRMLQTTTVDGASQKIPHIGWNKLVPSETGWDGTVLGSIVPGEFVYFVHSFTAVLENGENTVAHTEYGGHPVTAVIRSGNLYGCQFHPEKSGPAGLRIIRNFLRL